MTPDLPRNPMTISPQPRPAGSAEEVRSKFDRRLKDYRFYAEVRSELAQLRSYDAYFRTTSPARESAKSALQQILSKAGNSEHDNNQDSQATLRGMQGIA